MEVLIQVWFYGTPILYPLTMVPEKFIYLVNLNPLVCIFKGIHIVILKGAWPSIQNNLLVLGWTSVIFIFAFLVFNKMSNDLVESL